MENLEQRTKSPILDCRGVNGSMTLVLVVTHGLHRNCIAENTTANRRWKEEGGASS